MADYGKLPPGGTLHPKPFKAHADDEKLQQLKDLIRLSPIGPAVFENTNSGQRYGMRRDWLTAAKKHWQTQFDWRKHEDRINSYPNFTVPVRDSDGNEIDLHFVALFSRKPDAIPVALYHGWPGSFLEFLDILDHVKSRWSPEDLPYHIVVPSLPGYAYSSGPPLDRDYTMREAAMCLDSLMTGLGFRAYLAQGGDLGSYISRIQSAACDACKGCHLNMLDVPPPKNKDELHLEDIEREALPRGAEFRSTGFAYALEHGTKTATIGLVLSSSPIALLAWIGEKFLIWSDEELPLDRILESVTLYWLTDTFPRCIYPYRGNTSDHNDRPLVARGEYIVSGGSAPKYLSKPTGVSFFPKELFPAPESWARTVANVVSFKRHSSGGHFAAMELPKVLFADVEEWIPLAWKSSGGKL